MDREAMNSLLTKLGMPNPEGIEEDRAANRIRNRVKKDGLPDGLSSAEKAVIAELGIAVESAPVKTPAADASGKGGRERPPTPPEEVGKETEDTAMDTPVPFRLPGINGNPDRVEVISPKKAASRNRRRAEDRALTNMWELAPDVDPAKVPPEGMAVPLKNIKEKKSNQTPNPQKETAVAKTTTKTKKGEKPAKVTKPEKKAQTTKTAATKGDKATKTPAKKRESAGAEKFRALLEGGEAVKKETVIAKLTAAGVKPGTANSYIVWSKRPLSLGKTKNPFGFRIEETKDDKGVKILQRIAKKAK